VATGVARGKREIRVRDKGAADGLFWCQKETARTALLSSGAEPLAERALGVGSMLGSRSRRRASTAAKQEIVACQGQGVGVLGVQLIEPACR
jgi:hypothetical protein